MSHDAQLLREYVESRSEAAFAQLVDLHLPLIYRSALRQVGGDVHRAQEVAQSVFVLLAEKSRSLLDHPSLAGWLHKATHFKVSEFRRTDDRRRARDAAAQFLHEQMNDDNRAQEWERLRPSIDEVLLELSDTDREAVLLRFFEERAFADIAAHLNLTENTAHKRVERALDRLRERLSRRGVKSTAAALATVFGSQAALAAPPAGLAGTVTGLVIASKLPTAAAWGTGLLMSTKTAVTVSVVALAITGGIATQQVSAE